MTLSGALEGLAATSDGLASALSAARTTVCEDRPPGVAPLVVDDVVDALVEFDSEAQELRRRVDAGVRGPVTPTRLDALALTSTAQVALDDVADGLAARVAACDRLAEVERAVRRGGAPWMRWWGATVRGIAECDLALRDLRNALLGCWRELAETAGPGARLAFPDQAEDTRGGQTA